MNNDKKLHTFVGIANMPNFNGLYIKKRIKREQRVTKS